MLIYQALSFPPAISPHHDEVRRTSPPASLPRRIARRPRPLAAPLPLLQAIHKSTLLPPRTRPLRSINAPVSSPAAVHPRTVGYYRLPACVCPRCRKKEGSSGRVYEPVAVGQYVFGESGGRGVQLVFACSVCVVGGSTIPRSSGKCCSWIFSLPIR